ncbi:MAG: EFR1 family ferrodoxin [Candidatus Eremiobacteraeota bacterium]|nr:EFR1 family ferrodoxin [Candidatus Eremiobacteraeota bacterium]
MENQSEVKSVFRILYFSGTGNTNWVMKKIKDGLEEGGYSCEMLAADVLQSECGRDVGKGPDKELLAGRLKDFVPPEVVLILGFPVYGSNVPDPLKELLPLLPDGEGRKLATIATLHKAGGDACNLPEKMLEKRGYKSVLATYIKMPNNVKVPKFDFFEIKNGDELNSFYDSAGKAVEDIVDVLIEGDTRFEGKGIGDYILGISQRLGEQLFSDPFFVSHFFAHAKCIRCGLCAESCPMGNISMEKGYPDFGKNCCLCLRCYNFCPVNAIQITDATLNEKKYTRYKGFDGWKPTKLRKLEIKIEPVSS